jgi:TonB family protein
MPPRIRRLLCFTGASFALHAVTLVGFPPSGVSSAPYRGPTDEAHVLHATLTSARRVHFAASGAGPAEPQPTSASADAKASSDAPRPEARAQAREGVPGGADLPFPDKWYTAKELEVRAEPLSEIQLDYPQELEGTGIPGRVQILLFIDERGIVRRTAIVESEPAKLFEKAALRAWVDVKFSPARKGGVAVKSQKLLELSFNP